MAAVLRCWRAAPLAQAGNQKKKRWPTRCGWRCPTPSGRDAADAGFRNPSDRARYQNWLERCPPAAAQAAGRPDPQRIPGHRLVRSAAPGWIRAGAGPDPGGIGLPQIRRLAGARGYMQVMPFWTNVIGDRNRRALFHMQTNLRYGCAILRMYIDMEAGNLFLALGRYNGSRGKPEYPNAVLAAWNHWK
jgi:hypothetical protein